MGNAAKVPMHLTEMGEPYIALLQYGVSYSAWMLWVKIKKVRDIRLAVHTDRGKDGCIENAVWVSDLFRTLPWS